MPKSQPESQVVAERLRLGREQAGLSQGQVARLLDMHRPTISEIEAGRRRVEATELARFADIYAVTLDWLTGKTDIRANLEDERLKVVARDLDKMSDTDLSRVLEFIASIQGTKK